MERAKAVENNERAKLTTRGIEMAKQLDDDMLLNMHYQTSLQQHHLKEKRSLKDALEYKPKEYKTDSMRERLIREFAQNQMSI
jgi:BioD-like phosphotransacetylase family protein